MILSTQTYNVYTQEKVFADGSANIACNLLHQALINEFDETRIAAEFFLTGTTAKIIQGDPVSQIYVISFGTAEADVFAYAEKMLAKVIGAKGGVRFDDQIQITYSDKVFLEVFLIDTPGALVLHNQIVMQNKTNIPTYIS